MSEETNPVQLNPEVAVTLQAQQQETTNEDVAEQFSLPQNPKELILELSCLILGEFDSELADNVKNGIKPLRAYEEFSDMRFFCNHFKVDPVTLTTYDSTEIKFDLSLNTELLYTEFVEDLFDNIEYSRITNFIKENTLDSYMEDFYKEPTEREALEKAAKKKVVSHIKSTFKAWSVLLCRHFESNYNITVQVSDMRGSLRIVGLWTLNEDRSLNEQFYINPRFLADEVNKKVEFLSNSASKADEVTEIIKAVKSEEISKDLSGYIEDSLRSIPSSIESSITMAKTIKGMAIEAGEKPQEVSDTEETSEPVEEAVGATSSSPEVFQVNGTVEEI